MKNDTGQPTFSVVIPLYNRAEIVTTTIRSVLEQDFGDFEIIVVDDGSKDDPEPVVRAIGDPRIRYVRQDNAGGGAARNLGIEEARGRYIAFLDSDDQFLPGKLSIMAAALPDEDDTVLYSQMKVDRGVDRYWVRPERGIRGARMSVNICSAPTSSCRPRRLSCPPGWPNGSASIRRLKRVKISISPSGFRSRVRASG